jgi:anionic cell wall polymer biosynthesis LytR-Cps2A-Psr (LCP) family protein
MQSRASRSYRRTGSSVFARPAARRHTAHTSSSGAGIGSYFKTGSFTESEATLRRRSLSGRGSGILLILTILLAGFVLGATALVATQFFLDRAFSQTGMSTGTGAVVIFGVDDSGKRSDSVRILACGPGGLAQMPVPRDTLINLPGREPEKLTDLYGEFGPDGLCRLLSKQFGLKLTRYVVVRQDQLAKVVDTALAGVPFTLKEPIAFRDWRSHTLVSVPAGEGRVLHGAAFVAAARARGRGGDVGDRVPRQDALIRAALIRAVDRLRSNPARLSGMIAAARSFPSNLTDRERAFLAWRAGMGVANRRLTTISPEGGPQGDRFVLDPDGALAAGWKLQDAVAGRKPRRALVIEVATPELAARARAAAEESHFTVLAIHIVPPRPGAGFVAAPRSREWMKLANTLAKRLSLGGRVHRTPPRSYALLVLS